MDTQEIKKEYTITIKTISKDNIISIEPSSVVQTGQTIIYKHISITTW